MMKKNKKEKIAFIVRFPNSDYQSQILSTMNYYNKLSRNISYTDDADGWLCTHIGILSLFYFQELFKVGGFPHFYMNYESREKKVLMGSVWILK